MIALVRIDDRLLHGQVAIGWTAAVNANVILVVNDEVHGDRLKATAMDLAKPNNVTLYIRPVSESGEIVRKFAGSQKSSVIVVVKNTADALELVRTSGGVVREVNVGGLRGGPDKRKLTELVSVDEADLENFREMEKLGAAIELRMLPRDKKHLLGDYLKPELSQDGSSEGKEETTC